MGLDECERPTFEFDILGLNLKFFGHDEYIPSHLGPRLEFRKDSIEIVSI